MLLMIDALTQVQRFLNFLNQWGVAPTMAEVEAMRETVREALDTADNVKRQLRAHGQIETTANDLLEQFGGDYPDWLLGEANALEGALAMLARARAEAVGQAL
jgi:hypothetical protein